MFVVAFTLERQRVKWVLWLFFMEDIALTILPVREALLVVAGSNNWLLLIVVLCTLLKGWLNLVALVRYLVLSVALHPVGVDDFGLLLKVECFLSFAHQGALPVELEIFLVTTEKCFWIWVSNKLVGTSSFSLGFIANAL